MSAANRTRELLREWKAARTVRECAVERDRTTDGVEGSKAITAFKESAKAIVQAVMEEQNGGFTVADLTALLELAVSIADDEASETPADCLSVVRKAHRALKALRDAQLVQPPERPSYLELFGPLENKISDLATLARLVANIGTNCTIDMSRYEGWQREREEQQLQDVLAALSFIRDQAEALEEFLPEHWHEVRNSL